MFFFFTQMLIIVNKLINQICVLESIVTEDLVNFMIT